VLVKVSYKEGESILSASTGQPLSDIEVELPRTVHKWINRTDQYTRVIFVLVGAKEHEVDGVSADLHIWKMTADHTSLVLFCENQGQSQRCRIWSR
jgi:hypothetical protein